MHHVDPAAVSTGEHRARWAAMLKLIGFDVRPDPQRSATDHSTPEAAQRRHSRHLDTSWCALEAIALHDRFSIVDL